MTCQRIHDRDNPQLLIGGLGMGFTLRAALSELGPHAKCVVAELVPSVVAWARGAMAALFGSCLTDPRVTICEDDVGRLIRSGRASYDAILLDVDNGPAGLSRKANDRLYDKDGLAAARTALHPGGVLAVWSAAPDAKFTLRLRKAGFAVDEVRVRANGAGGGSRHIIWFATNPSASGDGDGAV
jgi:spermidine synthase